MNTDWEEYEYCTNCNANLQFQQGFHSELSSWTCKGCGTMLINPKKDWGNIVWICDICGQELNDQDGFTEDCEFWECAVCGCRNEMGPKAIFRSESEYESYKNHPYRGLSDDAVLQLSQYEEIGPIMGRSDIWLVEDVETKKHYVKKVLATYDLGIYQYLMEHPIAQMPQIVACFESANVLIVIEEFIEGITLSERLNQGLLSQEQAVTVAQSICTTASLLHTLEKPIIHRDIKPENIILTPDERVYLLDVNVAKWYRVNELEDTRFLGTRHYAAPEQAGFGNAASSEKSDIYAIGMLLNRMITGKFPKEEKADGKVGDVIEGCICLDPDHRYSDDELLRELDLILTGEQSERTANK